MAALSSALSFAVKELDWLEEDPIKRVRKFTESQGRVRHRTLSSGRLLRAQVGGAPSMCPRCPRLRQTTANVSARL